MEFNIRNFIITMDTNKMYLFRGQTKTGIVTCLDLITGKTHTFGRKQAFMLEDFCIKTTERLITLDEVFGLLQVYYKNRPLPTIADLNNITVAPTFMGPMKLKFFIPLQAFKTCLPNFDTSDFPPGNQLKVMKWYLSLVDIAKVVSIVSDRLNPVEKEIEEIKEEK